MSDNDVTDAVPPNSEAAAIAKYGQHNRWMKPCVRCGAFAESFWTVSGSNTTSGTTFGPHCITLEQAVVVRDERKAEHPEYDTWEIVKHVPMVRMSVEQM